MAGNAPRMKVWETTIVMHLAFYFKMLTAAWETDCGATDNTASGLSRSTALSESMMFVDCEDKKIGTLFVCKLMVCWHHKGCVVVLPWQSVFLNFLNLYTCTHMHCIFPVCVHIRRRETRMITKQDSSSQEE